MVCFYALDLPWPDLDCSALSGLSRESSEPFSAGRWGYPSFPGSPRVPAACAAGQGAWERWDAHPRATPGPKTGPEPAAAAQGGR